ncbi:DUF4871 domain-containing protein [Lysinibacillus xylanilyticus]|uniref:hypothetical protein n=1 Tax=Lysinibacillus xylanilyticus TaxID=582475 RepID=UPI002B2491C3|nr:hypothetical protein [Lysinibacillus xylanilyticus]MEB2300138.1 DUF4871 domain-containing protein [Lysinibacillus xylanilyticus]
MRRWIVLFSVLLFLAGCTMNEKEVALPNDLPDFVQESDFTSIDWGKKATGFGERGIIGNANKSGVIGADMPSLNTQKWMWHLWGIEEGHDTKLTIVGYHKDSKTVHPILVDGWTTGLGGPVNGADAHTPSSVKIPKPGEWAILLYKNESYFDTLIYDITE